ncbi:MAG: sulfurtransferase [Halothiobacillaceae bacterium]
MTSPHAGSPSLLIEANELKTLLGRDDILLVDMTALEQYRCGHLPGAIHLDFIDITAERPPASGLLPTPEHFNACMRALGLREGMHLIAYDECGGLKACRLLWTLHTFGFTAVSLLNGGLEAWQAEGLPLETGEVVPAPSSIELRYTGAGVRTAEEILQRLGRPDVVLLDARSAGEFLGHDIRSVRGGHIPGAVHFEWSRALDPLSHHRFRSPNILRDELAALGITPDKEVIAYCQTHRRSCVSWFTLRLLGFPQAYGYPGAWSDWGNRPELPVGT